jgi:hypothetical protein
MKVKIGAPAEASIARARLVREVAGPDILLSADSNWIFDVDEALIVGRALADLGYVWFEEPIVPEDIEGYRWLRDRLPLRLAAGESDTRRQGAPRSGLARTRADPPDCALRRHQRDPQDRHARPCAARPLRTACRGQRCCLRRRQPAARGRHAELHDLRVHDLPQSPARRVPCGAGGDDGQPGRGQRLKVPGPAGGSASELDMARWVERWMER